MPNKVQLKVILAAKRISLLERERDKIAREFNLIRDKDVPGKLYENLDEAFINVIQEEATYLASLK